MDVTMAFPEAPIGGKLMIDWPLARSAQLKTCVGLSGGIEKN